MREKYELKVLKSDINVALLCIQQRVHGERMENVTIGEKILCSMTPKFNFVICSIEESKDIDVMSTDELKSSLVVHEWKSTNGIEKRKP